MRLPVPALQAAFLHTLWRSKAKQSEAKRRVVSAAIEKEEEEEEEETSDILFQCFNFWITRFACLPHQKHVLELRERKRGEQEEEEEEAATKRRQQSTQKFWKLTSSSTKEIHIRIHNIKRARREAANLATCIHTNIYTLVCCIWKILLSAAISKCSSRARVCVWMLRATLACVSPPFIGEQPRYRSPFLHMSKLTESVRSRRCSKTKWTQANQTQTKPQTSL